MKKRKHFVPVLACGECSINLAWDDLTPAQQKQAVDQHCHKCGFYKEIKDISPDEACVLCGRYAPNGHLCWSCQNETK